MLPRNCAVCRRDLMEMAFGWIMESRKPSCQVFAPWQQSNPWSGGNAIFCTSESGRRHELCAIHGNLDHERPKTNNPCNPCLTISMHNGATQNQEARLYNMTHLSQPFRGVRWMRWMRWSVVATLECSAPCPSC